MLMTLPASLHPCLISSITSCLSPGLNRLGCFEANKDRIVEKGVLPLYLELVEKSCNEDERLIAAQGLWIFGYSDRCRNLIQNDAQMLSGIVPTFVYIHSSIFWKIAFFITNFRDIA